MSTDAICDVTEYDDGDFIRTAVVVTSNGTSFDLVDSAGTRIAEINAFPYYDEDNNLDHVIIDVIDKDDVFGNNRALTFNNGQRTFTEATHLVSADFRKKTIEWGPDHPSYDEMGQ